MTGLLPQTKPFFLGDVVKMKRNRGDNDLADFKLVVREFAYGINADIRGSEWSMQQWVERRKPWISDAQHARRVKFLADIRAVLDGSFGPEWFQPQTEGAHHAIAAE